MKIENIVRRQNGTPVSQEEAVFLVEQYIKDTKGVKVDINIFKGIRDFRNMDILESFHLQEQIELLFTAYIKASDYFNKKFI